MIWQRICPQCKKEVFHKSKFTRNDSERKKKRCKRCACKDLERNEKISVSKTGKSKEKYDWDDENLKIVWIRFCPHCHEIQKYAFEKYLIKAELREALCRSCVLKKSWKNNESGYNVTRSKKIIESTKCRRKEKEKIDALWFKYCPTVGCVSTMFYVSPRKLSNSFKKNTTCVSCHLRQSWSDPNSKFNDPEFLKQRGIKTGKSRKIYFENPDNRKKVSEGVKKLWNDGTYSRDEYSKRMKEYWENPESEYNKPEYVKKQSDSQNIRWQSIPFDSDVREQAKMLKVKHDVRTRDGMKCVLCGINGCILHVHHIIPIFKFPELRFYENNMITLCCECHSYVHRYNFSENNLMKYLRQFVQPWKME